MCGVIQCKGLHAQFRGEGVTPEWLFEIQDFSVNFLS